MRINQCALADSPDPDVDQGGGSLPAASMATLDKQRTGSVMAGERSKRSS